MDPREGRITPDRADAPEQGGVRDEGPPGQGRRADGVLGAERLGREADRPQRADVRDAQGAGRVRRPDERQQGLLQAVCRLSGSDGQAVGDYRLGGVRPGVGQPAVPVPAQRPEGARLPARRDPPRPRVAELLRGVGRRGRTQPVAEGGVRIRLTQGAHHVPTYPPRCSCAGLWLPGEQTADPGRRQGRGGQDDHGRHSPTAVTRGGPSVSRSLLVLILCTAPAAGDPPRLEAVRVSKDGKGFVLEPSGKKFIPWGFNYDHDAKGRLIEDYWADEWPAIEGDFAEMKQLGANVVRVHLQFGKFMTSADKPNAKTLDRLGELLKLAEKTGLYLDLTGLGCYHKADVPEWYDKLSESDRWAAQAKFWEAVAGRCKESPAVFCYDLMNEPVVPGGKRKPGDWLGPPFGDKHFVQVITLDQAGRKRPDIAHEWVKHLAGAIRKVDKDHLITVGLVDWSLDRPGLTSGFGPKAIADE